MVFFTLVFLIFTYFVLERLLQLQRQLKSPPRPKLSTGFPQVAGPVDNLCITLSTPLKLSTGYPQVYPQGPERPQEARGATFSKVIREYA